MTRWADGSRERLQEAALALYAEQGYAETTVAAVAARAGLTERTYFRHFPDKREVLFAEDDALLSHLLAGVASAPAGASAWEQAHGALRAFAEVLEPRRATLRVRAAVLASDPGLVERDATKQARWVAALEGAITERGAEAEEAALAAAVAGAVFRVAYTRWLAEPGGAGLEARFEDATRSAGQLSGAR